MVTWNSENNVKLLLMVIQNHFHGSPDYEWLAREWDSEVTVASLRIQFCKLRREGVKGVKNFGGGGRVVKSAGATGGKGARKGRKGVKLEEREGDMEMVMDGEEGVGQEK